MSISCKYPLLVIGLLAAGIGHTAESVKPQASGAVAASAGAPASNLKIWQDPATGEWKDHPVTEAQKRAASQAGAVDFSKIKTIRHADGSIEYQMNGQMVDTLVARRGEDGKLHITCSEHGLEHDHSATTTSVPASGGRDVR